MNGDIAKLNARVDDLTDDVSSLKTTVRELEERLNQEETDREHADTALQDNIDRVEREQS